MEYDTVLEQVIIKAVITSNPPHIHELLLNYTKKLYRNKQMRKKTMQ